MVGDLEVVPRRRFDYRGVHVEEMDVDAILARKPRGRRGRRARAYQRRRVLQEKRHQDIRAVRDAGINVIPR